MSWDLHLLYGFKIGGRNWDSMKTLGTKFRLEGGERGEWDISIDPQSLLNNSMFR